MPLLYYLIQCYCILGRISSSFAKPSSIAASVAFQKIKSKVTRSSDSRIIDVGISMQRWISECLNYSEVLHTVHLRVQPSHRSGVADQCRRRDADKWKDSTQMVFTRLASGLLSSLRRSVRLDRLCGQHDTHPQIYLRLSAQVTSDLILRKPGNTSLKQDLSCNHGTYNYRRPNRGKSLHRVTRHAFLKVSLF